MIRSEGRTCKHSAVIAGDNTQLAHLFCLPAVRDAGGTSGLAHCSQHSTQAHWGLLHSQKLGLVLKLSSPMPVL